MNSLRSAMFPLVAAIGFSLALADDEKRKPATNSEDKKPAEEASDDKTSTKPKITKIVKSEAEWKKQLTPLQYYVTRRKGTEFRRTGATWNLYDPGTYSCVCCDLVLFSSETKFKSGTGWPSFYDAAVPGHVATKEDNQYGWERIEMLCSRCDAHLGHLFDDGPKPTGLRYCANSAALKFTPKDVAKKDKDAVGQEKKNEEKRGDTKKSARKKDQ